MPLVLNLHHEIDKQRAISRRDPLKFAVGGIAAIVLGFAGYYFYQMNVTHGVEGELAQAQDEFKKLDAKAALAKKREDELNVTMKSSDFMVKRVEDRFYWAPVLGVITRVVPREVQLTKLSGDVSGEGLKRCTLTIDGVAAGSEPRKTAEDLRKTLAEQFASKYKNVTSTFKSLEDSNEAIKLEGKPAKTADFSINVQLQIGEEPATPAPVTSKKRKSA